LNILINGGTVLYTASCIHVVLQTLDDDKRFAEQMQPRAQTTLSQGNEVSDEWSSGNYLTTHLNEA
jgi:hypothetical protein